MADNDLDLKEFGIGQVSNTELQDGLAEFVRRAYGQAKRHKESTGVHQRLVRDLRAKLTEYAPEDAEMVAGADVYIGICALKQRAAESWLIDIIVNNIEKPWTMEPTPEPDLPERMKLRVVDMLMKELPDFQSFAALKDRAQQIKSAVQAIASKESANSVARMETRVHDQLTEGGWAKTFTTLVNHITTYPAAILRGPIEIGQPVAKWKKDKLVVEHGTILSMRNVNPFDAFPAPNSTNAQNGAYFIERIDYSPSDLHNLIGVKGFSGANLRAALDKYEDGFRIETFTGSEERTLRGSEEGINENSDQALEIETLIYNGKIPGKMLVKHGVLVEDPQKYYEAEVWVIGDLTVRAALTPNPLGKRPLYSTSFVKVDGKFWGNGVIDLVYDTERICNATARAMVRNVGYASGPIGEYDSDRLAEGENIRDIAPYHMFRVGPDLTGSGQPAIRFENITMIGGELMTLFENNMKLADDLSGVPAYVLGNPQVAGAGRTLGGLSMLMGNAAKGIKNVQLNIDMDVIAEVVEAFYMYNMQISNDIGIKADAKVVARGANGLLQRELAQTRSVELLQLIVPFIVQGLHKDPLVSGLLREVFKNTGINVEKYFPDPDAAFNTEELMGLLGPGAGAFNSGAGAGNGQPNLPPQSMPPPEMPQMAPYPTPVNLPQGA